MISSAHLDWLSITFPRETFPHETLPRGVTGFPFTPKGKGMHGYRERVVNDLGVTVMCDGTDLQGTHAVYPGHALEAIRALGISDQNLCQYIDRGNGRASRVDLAINIHGGNMTVDDVARDFIEGRLTTPARSGLHRKGALSDDNNFTLGNRQSERYLRCYDKNAEQHIVDADAWLRLELECKKLRARALVRVLAEHENTRAVINSAIGDFVVMSDDNDISQALHEQGVTIPPRPRKLTSTYAWLLEQVAPAMARYHVDHPDDNIEQAFITMFHVEIERFSGSAV